MSENVENLSIEEAFQALEEILAQMDKGGGSLEDSFGRYQQGLDLVKYLEGKIDGIEKKIRILQADAPEERE